MNRHAQKHPFAFLWPAVLVVALLLAGCQETGTMNNQPRYDPLEPSALLSNGQSAQIPPSGSVAYTGGKPVDTPANTGLDASGNPVTGFPPGVEVNQDLVKLGQERYNIYCIPCHGPQGKGDGKVIAFGFPKPPNLLGDNVKGLPNGQIFQIIEKGQGKMFSYGYRVKAPERWAVISYIRAMELKNGQVNPTELTPDELNQLGK